jgi:hypothetical protein
MIRLLALHPADVLRVFLQALFDSPAPQLRQRRRDSSLFC